MELNPAKPPPLGERAADWLESKIGWPFLIIQNGLIFAWCTLNSALVLGSHSLDPFPWVLLNLLLSFQAAQTGPIVLIAGRRQEALQRLTLQQILDIVTTLKATIQVLMEHHTAGKARDAVLLEHVQSAAERDASSVLRDKEIIDRLARVESILEKMSTNGIAQKPD